MIIKEHFPLDKSFEGLFNPELTDEVNEELLSEIKNCIFETQREQLYYEKNSKI